MGWRYRKSINLGGGFRVNLSKNGIGYSWGVKGYRVTKTADGRTGRPYPSQAPASAMSRSTVNGRQASRWALHNRSEIRWRITSALRG